MAKTQPNIVKKSPYAIQVERKKDYSQCACGQSKNQPFCDGSRKGRSFIPAKYSADKTDTVYFCGCKHGGGKPLCDGTRNAL